MSGSNGASRARPVTRRGSRAPGGAVGRRRPALDVDPHQLAGVDQLRDRRLALGRRQAVVVAQVGLGGDAQRRGGAADQRAHRLVALRLAGVDLGRQHALGELVGPAEAAARARGERPGGEEVLAGHLDVRALSTSRRGRGPRGRRRRRAPARPRSPRAGRGPRSPRARRRGCRAGGRARCRASGSAAVSLSRIRQRNSGQSSTGSRLASCTQYSTIVRRRRCAAVCGQASASRASRSYGPSRANSGA